MNTLIVTSLISMFVGTAYASDHSSKVDELGKTISAEGQAAFKDAVTQMKAKTSDGGETITNKEFETLTRFSKMFQKGEPGPMQSSGASPKDIQAHVDKIKAILNSSQEKGYAADAKKCLAFVDLIHKERLGIDPVELADRGSKTVRHITTGFSLPSFDQWSEDQYELVHQAFQRCRLLVNQSTFPDYCDGRSDKGPDCPNEMLFSTHAEVIQKLNSATYLANVRRSALNKFTKRITYDLTKDQLLVASESIASTGQILIFAVRTGFDKATMANGFDKQIPTVTDIGVEKLSSLVCRFNEYKTTMRKKYGKQFFCGYKLTQPGFHRSSDISFTCVPAKAVKDDGFVTKGVFVKPLTWSYCSDS